MTRAHLFTMSMRSTLPSSSSSKSPWGSYCFRGGLFFTSSLQRGLSAHSQFRRWFLPTLAQRSHQEWKDTCVELKPVCPSWGLDHGRAVRRQNTIGFKHVCDTCRRELAQERGSRCSSASCPGAAGEASAGTLCSPRALPIALCPRRLRSQEFFSSQTSE